MITDAKTYMARVNTLRKTTLDILKDLTERIDKYDLPKLPNIIDLYRQKLVDNHYTALVVGEASKGKSSFVNALIGRSLLPTDVAVTTNQVFSVSHATREAYRLRFEDGHTTPINADELMVYGSQTTTNQEKRNEVNLNLLRWIEIEVPCQLLPPNVSLLDTPGLGSLYAGHAQITHRFIPRADAVIFVLDSRGEMEQTEKDCIDAILKHTNHIFFLQTHIDRHDPANWQKVLKANEEILQEHFQGLLDDTRVWPISNVNLLKAASSNKAFLRKLSRAEETLPALEAFLFKTAGWERCHEALTAISTIYMEAQKVLIGRQVLLESTPEQERNEVQQREARWKQFDAEWGNQGQKREQLRSEVGKITANTRQNTFVHDLETRIKRSMQDRINDLTSIEEANTLGKTISAQVTEEVVNMWRFMCEESGKRCIALLGPMAEDVEALIPQPDYPHLMPHVKIHTPPSDGLFKHLWLFIEVDAAALTIIKTIAGATIIQPFILIAAPAIASIWIVAQRIKYHVEKQLKKAQDQLHACLDDLMREVDEQFNKPNALYGDKSLVRLYFDTLEINMNGLIERIVERNRVKVRDELAHLDEQIKLTKQERAARAEKLREHIARWDQLGRVILEATAELKSLEQV